MKPKRPGQAVHETHYEVQNRRRSGLVEAARAARLPAVLRPADVDMVYSPARRTMRGVWAGADGGRPTRVLDATVHEIEPGATTTVHRHSWDAILFVTEGEGWTEIDGRRIAWRPWDTLHLPSWSWHRHGCTSHASARFLTWSVEPMFESLGMALIEEGGDASFEELPAPRMQRLDISGNDPYANRLRRLAVQATSREGSRLVTHWDDVVGMVTKRGARSAFLVDSSIGYRTTGITAVVHELAPGLWQSRHRHGGEAWLYALSGIGRSVIDGVEHEWEAGDLVVIDHWQWHQHFNRSSEKTARLIRVHNFDALYDTMRVLLDPLPIWEEPEQLDAPDTTNVVWPDHQSGRPGRS